MVASLLAGCVQSLPFTALPSSDKSQRPVLTSEQQTAAIGEVARKKQEEREKAIREIENRK